VAQTDFNIAHKKCYCTQSLSFSKAGITLSFQSCIQGTYIMIIIIINYCFFLFLFKFYFIFEVVSINNMRVSQCDNSRDAYRTLWISLSTPLYFWFTSFLHFIYCFFEKSSWARHSIDNAGEKALSLFLRILKSYWERTKRLISP
jgi:hypothetical protein